MEQSSTNSSKPADWHGLPRETIDWHPTVDESKCIGCGMCVTGCGRKVYDYDYERHKAVVTRPLNCMVGCTTCQVTCTQSAINFPEKQMVRNLIREKHLLTETKRVITENPDKYAAKR